MDETNDPWRRLTDGDKEAWDEAVTTVFGRVRVFFANKVSDANESNRCV